MPVGDGRAIWNLLTDDRARQGIIMAERFAGGNAALEEMVKASAAARTRIVEIMMEFGNLFVDKIGKEQSL